MCPCLQLADQVSDAVLDACLEQDPESKVACETATKTNLVSGPAALPHRSRLLTDHHLYLPMSACAWRACTPVLRACPVHTEAPSNQQLAPHDCRAPMLTRTLPPRPPTVPAGYGVR